MIQQTSQDTFFISKGTPFPFLCPKCEAVIPFNKDDEQLCWNCGYTGLTEEFDDVEWEFTPAS